MVQSIVGNMDESLLTMVIAEADRVARLKGKYVGRTAIQKIMYYLQVQGVPMRYKFDIYLYGPYCQDIVEDIESLMADGAITDERPDTSKYSNYAPASKAHDVISRYASEFEAYTKTISSTVAGIIPLDPGLMELMATLDYILRAEKATGKSHELKKSVVNRFMEVKKDKFQRDMVESMYDTVAQFVTES